MTGLLPNLVARIPVIGIAATDPAPRQRSRNPRAPSPTPSRILVKGTRGAQQATPKPAAAKQSRVASRGFEKSPTMDGISDSRHDGLSWLVASQNRDAGLREDC